MNQVIMKGRITKDVELKTTSNGKELANFSVAVQRNFKNAEGNYDADFFNCTAFGNTAKLVSTHFVKGSEILLTGRLQNRTWDDNNGTKHYATDIIVDRVEFCGSKVKPQNDLQYEASLSNIPSIDKSDDFPF